MDLSNLRSNLNKEQEGTWVDIGKDAKLKIARIGNPQYKETFRRLTKPYQRQMRSGNLPDEVAEKILARCLAESILLDWQGLEMDGEPIQYSKKAATDLLMNAQLRDFRDMVTELAGEAELFRQEEMEEAEKN